MPLPCHEIVRTPAHRQVYLINVDTAGTTVPLDLPSRTDSNPGSPTAKFATNDPVMSYTFPDSAKSSDVELEDDFIVPPSPFGVMILDRPVSDAPARVSAGSGRRRAPARKAHRGVRVFTIPVS